MTIPGTVLQVARRSGGFATFLEMVETLDLGDMLDLPAKHTLFAPTDEAFSKVPKATLAKLKRPEEKLLLKAVVTMHLAAGQVVIERLKGRRIRGKSIEGSDLVISGVGAGVVNGAAIVRPDIMAANGVLHGIDRVLWPKLPRAAAESVVLA